MFLVAKAILAGMSPFFWLLLGERKRHFGNTHFFPEVLKMIIFNPRSHTHTSFWSHCIMPVRCYKTVLGESGFGCSHFKNICMFWSGTLRYLQPLRLPVSPMLGVLYHLSWTETSSCYCGQNHVQCLLYITHSYMKLLHKGMVSVSNNGSPMLWAPRDMS